MSGFVFSGEMKQFQKNKKAKIELSPVDESETASPDVDEFEVVANQFDQDDNVSVGSRASEFSMVSAAASITSISSNASRVSIGSVVESEAPSNVQRRVHFADEVDRVSTPQRQPSEERWSMPYRPPLEPLNEVDRRRPPPTEDLNEDERRRPTHRLSSTGYRMKDERPPPPPPPPPPRPVSRSYDQKEKEKDEMMPRRQRPYGRGDAPRDREYGRADVPREREYGRSFRSSYDETTLRYRSSRSGFSISDYGSSRGPFSESFQDWRDRIDNEQIKRDRKRCREIGCTSENFVSGRDLKNRSFSLWDVEPGTSYYGHMSRMESSSEAVKSLLVDRTFTCHGRTARYPVLFEFANSCEASGPMNNLMYQSNKKYQHLAWSFVCFCNSS